MQGPGSVQGKPESAGGSDHSDSVEFTARLVVHIVYDNEHSAKVAGHKQHGYATAKVTSPVWFKDKDAFMGMICNAFERFYDEMKVGTTVSEDK
jgi:hypothetical protein